MTHQGGLRESEWHVLRRCLQLLVRLQRSPTSSQELGEISRDGEALSSAALQSRLRNDLKRLRENLGCEILFSRRAQTYTLDKVGVPLLDLPTDSVTGLAFLLSTFYEDAPMGKEVQALVSTIQRLLPYERLEDIRRERRLIALDLQPQDSDEIEEETWNIVQTACHTHRLLEFDYYSPSHEDGQPRHNLVEPVYTFFEDGHYYLRAFCRRVTGPKISWNRQEFVRYRMGRIRNPQALPDVFVPREARPRYELVYELSAQVARSGVTRHFPDSIVTAHPDGSVLIHTKVEDLFLPLRTLLHYGPGCRVVGGEEAVTQMRMLTTAMYDLYNQA